MSPNSNTPQVLPPYIKITVLLLLIVLVILLLYWGETFLMPVSLAALLATLLSPVQQKLENIGINKTLTILLCILMLFVVLGGLIWLTTSQLLAFSRDIPELSGAVSKKLDVVQSYIENKTDIAPERQISFLREKLTEWLENSGSMIKSTIAATTSTLTLIALLPIYIFFFMFYRKKFKNFLYRLTNEKNHYQLTQITKQIKTVVQSYLVGVLTVILILAVLNTVGLSLLGIRYALFLGILAAILNIIPYIGILIGNILAASVAFLTKDSIWYTVGVIAIFAFIQFVENNFLTPMITGAKVQINPLATIMALILGGQLWGVAGMIIFIPFLGVVKVILDNIDHLRPYGYLLGTSENMEKQEEEGQWKQSIKKLFEVKSAKGRKKH